VISLKLDNFYDFRDWRDVTRYKTRLQDALHSIGSTRLPRVTVIRHKRPGPMRSAENSENDSTTLLPRIFQ
jgi:hypothetical protein